MNQLFAGNHLLAQAGIGGIPLDENGSLVPLYISSDIEASNNDLALIGCWYGQDDLRLSATMTALEWTLKSKPFPKIYIVEAAKKECKRYFSEIKDITYIQREIRPESEGIWMKEALWSIGAREAIKDGYTKLVFIDLDCSFVHQNWVVKVSESFKKYDVISPHICYYMSGQIDGIKKGVMVSKGYMALSGNPRGQPGMGLGMTADFFTNKLNSFIPNFADSAGDTFFWLSLRDFSPSSPICKSISHVMREEDCVGIKPRPKIGHGGQVLVHHPHGLIANRNYNARAWITRECFPRFRDGVAYFSDGMPYFSDAERGEIFKKAMGIVKSSNRFWSWEEASIMCRKLLQDAGLKTY